MKVTTRQLRKLIQEQISSGGWGSYADQRKSQEEYERETKGMPFIVNFQGQEYYWTGKVGHDVQTGAPSREYEDDNHGRVWMDIDGSITPD